MRLLRATGDEDFSLTEHVQSIPPYAILSHTWGADEDEVTFKDIYKGKGKGKSKPGYAKLRFCSDKAAEDGLEYFWVDTCCIDKSSSAELSEAINSMYNWYHDSAKCYVYLSDVPDSYLELSNAWIDKWVRVRASKWFRRGWTLQELLAPKDLSIFAADGCKIGTRSSLSKVIAECTSIPRELFEEKGRHHLYMYSVRERLRWAACRETKRPEDTAYCLLGIFGVQMPLIYGEGKGRAMSRLLKHIQEYEDGSVPLYRRVWIFVFFRYCDVQYYVERQLGFPQTFVTLPAGALTALHTFVMLVLITCLIFAIVSALGFCIRYAVTYDTLTAASLLCIGCAMVQMIMIGGLHFHHIVMLLLCCLVFLLARQLHELHDVNSGLLSLKNQLTDTQLQQPPR